MNNIAVIYKSRYGTTKKYAQWISQALEARLFEASEVKPSQLADYDVVVFGGGLYMGRIDGVKLVAEIACKKLVVFTVGLEDPKTADYAAVLGRAFTPGQLAQIGAFHLRGAIAYKNLGLLHKGMMAILKKSALKEGKTQLSSEEMAIVETRGEDADFTDRDSIAPLVGFVREQLSAPADS